MERNIVEKEKLSGDVAGFYRPIENASSSDHNSTGFHFKYLSEDQMTVMQLMARRKLRKEREKHEWMQFMHQTKLDEQLETTNAKSNNKCKIEGKKTNESSIRTLKTDNPIIKNKETFNNSANLRRMQRTIDNQSKMLSGLIGQVQNLSKSVKQNPDNFVANTTKVTPKVHNYTQKLQLFPRLASKRPVKHNHNTKNRATIRKDKIPGFLGMTLSQQQKTKVITQPPKACFSRPIQKTFKQNVLTNKPTLLKDEQHGISQTDYFQTGEMLKRISEMEAEAREIHNRWITTSHPISSETVVTSAGEIVNSQSEKKPEKIHNRLHSAPISGQATESINTNLKRFIHNANSSDSASTKPLEIVADSIVDDMITAVTQELNKMADDVIHDLVEAEFVQRPFSLIAMTNGI